MYCERPHYHPLSPCTLQGRSQGSTYSKCLWRGGEGRGGERRAEAAAASSARSSALSAFSLSMRRVASQNCSAIINTTNQVRGRPSAVLDDEGKVLMLIIRHLPGTAHSVLVVLNQRGGGAYMAGGPGSRLLLVRVSGPQSQSRARVRSPEGLSGCHRWPGDHSTVSPSREQIHPRATPKGFARCQQ